MRYFFSVPQHYRYLQKEKEGQRGEFYFCIPIAVRLVIDREKYEERKRYEVTSRVGCRAQKIPLFGISYF